MLAPLVEVADQRLQTLRLAATRSQPGSKAGLPRGVPRDYRAVTKIEEQMADAG